MIQVLLVLLGDDFDWISMQDDKSRTKFTQVAIQIGKGLQKKTHPVYTNFSRTHEPRIDTEYRIKVG